MSDKALESYFREARDWDMDRAAQGVTRERVAWLTSMGGWSLAVILGTAIAFLTPLKRVEPLIIRVDNTTGIVDVVPRYAGNVDIGEMTARFLLTRYVTTCEHFLYITAQLDYEECGAFHSGERNAQWYRQWVQTNPASPLNQNSDGSVVTVTVTSISFLNKDPSKRLTNLAQVRYIKARRSPGGSERVTHWIATIEYVWGTPSRQDKERQLNPLGWRVTEFRSEPETIPDSQSLPNT